MPEPLLYVHAMGAAGGLAALLVLVLGGHRPSPSVGRMNAACVVAIATGAVCGFSVLGLWPGWPPVKALDRLLTIVLPAAVAIELLASVSRTPRALTWSMRLGLSIVAGRILLRGSVYLVGASPEWTAAQAVAVLAACAAVLAALWMGLSRLADRTPGVSIPLALALSIQSAGLAVMLAGYLKGGAAAFPLAAALAGAAIASRRFALRATVPAAIGVGVVSLFGLLFIGRFFGGLSTASALTMLLAPLLCWITEVPPLRRRDSLTIGVLRVLFVAVPYLVVLGLAAVDFSRHTAPLL